MGLLFADMKQLIECRDGKSGGAAATLGHLSLYLHRREIGKMRSLIKDAALARSWCDSYRWGQTADTFFRDVLRMDTVDSIDFSDFEGATIVCDLGVPVARELHRKFDLVVDGGTLEHIFMIPTAFANMMNMTRLGGYLYIHGNCNNQTGHGFYQFSPELMYRAFGKANGFEPVVRLARARYFGAELTGNHAVYDVVDPVDVGRRVTLISRQPILVMTLARRISDVDPFTQPVLQSDYVIRWEGKTLSETRARTALWLKAAVRRHTPLWVARNLQGLVQRRRSSLSNRHFFRRLW
jgi:hypothetical protein